MISPRHTAGSDEPKGTAKVQLRLRPQRSLRGFSCARL